MSVSLMMLKRFLVLLAAAGPLLLSSAPAVSGGTPMSFGVVPQQSVSKLAHLWTPVVLYLNSRTGEAFYFKTAKDIPTFESRLAEGSFDVAYMNPYHYTVFHQSPGYEAIAREKGHRIQGILCVRKDSPIIAISQLAGQKVAFPAQAAFAASILPRAFLKKSGIAVTPVYVSSHDSVYRSVAKGLYPAGGGIKRTLGAMAPDVSGQLRILWVSNEYTPHAIAVHPRVPAQVVDKLRQALVDMATDADGRRLLQRLNFEGIESARDADWNDIRSLEINLLDDLIGK